MQRKPTPGPLSCALLPVMRNAQEHMWQLPPVTKLLAKAKQQMLPGQPEVSQGLNPLLRGKTAYGCVHQQHAMPHVKQSPQLG
jgi:hypothetical protein